MGSKKFLHVCLDGNSRGSFKLLGGYLALFIGIFLGLGICENFKL
jgi:hypothetical protein